MLERYAVVAFRLLLNYLDLFIFGFLVAFCICLFIWSFVKFSCLLSFATFLLLWNVFIFLFKLLGYLKRSKVFIDIFRGHLEFWKIRWCLASTRTGRVFVLLLIGSGILFLFYEVKLESSFSIFITHVIKFYILICI